MSKYGLFISSAYLIILVICAAVGKLSNIDSKGKFVILQLPISLQGALIDAIGFGQFLERFDWIVLYVVIGGTTTVALYIFGHLLDSAVK